LLHQAQTPLAANRRQDRSRARKLSDVTPPSDTADASANEIPPALTRRQRRERTARALVTAAGPISARRREALLDYVVRLNLCVARDVAGRYVQPGCPEDAILRVAYDALARAARDFEPGQHEDFLSFAVSAIRGEIAEQDARAWAVPGAAGWTPGT
jgi:RNA polymerase sigma-B factor